jgi:tetraacyldisaccharide 4'-kinase
MRAPGFWNHKGLLSTLLLPLSWVYSAAASIKESNARAFKASVPVICVGNLTVGGAGKTPVAMAIGEKCKKHGIPAYFLTRGYGGKLEGPVLVDTRTHRASDVGDEPLMLARVLPTVVARDRAAGAKFAIEKGAAVLIMDDGLQNPSLLKDLSLLVIDGGSGLGNGRVMPAGPLREPAKKGFERANGIIVVGSVKNNMPIFPRIPVIFAKVKPQQNMLEFRGKPMVAFCGIAKPEKFFSMLEESGVTLSDRIAFDDHHPYAHDEIRMLKAKGVPLVTTAKDAVRLPPDFRPEVNVIDISLEFENEALLDSLLSKAFSSYAPIKKPS